MAHCLALRSLSFKEGEDQIKSATLFTTRVDQPHGDLKVFVDEDRIRALENAMSAEGYLDGTRMATAFNMLRSGDLVWPYVVNNYMRSDPAAVDTAYLECRCDAYECSQPLLLLTQLLP